MEKRAAREKAVEEDHKMAVELQKSEQQQAAASGGGISSVARAMLEADNEGQGNSIYRDTTSTKGNGYNSSKTYGQNKYGSSKGTNSSTSLEPSTEAQSRYANSKSISSDQFFGRDESHAEEMRSKNNNSITFKHFITLI